MSWRWWEQAGIDLEGAKKRAEDEATDLESESELYLGGDDLSVATRSSGADWSGAEEWIPLDLLRARIEEG